ACLTERVSFMAAALQYGLFFFFQAEDGIRDFHVTGVQTCALPILVGYIWPVVWFIAGDLTLGTRGLSQYQQGWITIYGRVPHQSVHSVAISSITIGIGIGTMEMVMWEIRAFMRRICVCGDWTLALDRKLLPWEGNTCGMTQKKFQRY